MNTYFKARFNTFQLGYDMGFVAQILAITHHVHKTTMDRLVAGNRYQKLSLGYERYISSLAERDYSPGDLARKLAVSKQACSKTVRELEQLGLVARRSNPGDRRSSLMSLTAGGQQLVQDGIEASAGMQEQFAAEVGTENLEKLVDGLDQVCAGLGIEILPYRALESSGRQTRLHLLLYSLSNHCYQHLIEALGSKGFKALKPNFGQVLGLIGPEGGRIQAISSLVGVSKQAIAVLASEIEELGYLVREPDPNDRRQLILKLSPQGKKLLAESTACVDELANLIGSTVGRDTYRHLETTVAALYLQVIGHYNTQTIEPGKIEQISRQLLEKLGVAGARTLAQQLLIGTRGDLK